MIGASLGVALRPLSIALAIGLLASCSQQPEPATRPSAKTAKADVDELEALIAAVKQHPSLVDPQKNAGPPIHVDPYPHSRGAPPHMHMMK